MKRSVLIGIAVVLGFGAFDADAAGRRSCVTLEREIAARIEASGVRSYSLQIVEPDAPVAGTIVGSCDGGSRRIAYRRVLLQPAPDASVAAADTEVKR